MALIAAFQVTATSAAQQLPSNLISKGPITLTAKTGNSAAIAVGVSNGVTSSNGYLLAAGTSVTVNVTNTNQLWINGTANDVLSVLGA